MDLLTRKELADQFRVKPCTVKKWEDDKIIKRFLTINGRPRYNLEEVRNVFLNLNRTNDTI